MAAPEAEAPAEAPAPVPARARAPEWLDAARAWPLVTAAPIVSQHLGRPHLAEIRVSPEAADDYRRLTPDTELSPGSFFVEWLRDASTARLGAIFALERTPETWRYWVLDARGVLVESGALALCAGCHAGAPAAPVFGLPNPSEESTATVPRSP